MARRKRIEIGYEWKGWRLSEESPDGETMLFACPRCSNTKSLTSERFSEIRRNRLSIHCKECHYGAPNGRRGRYYIGVTVMGWKIAQCEIGRIGKDMVLECPKCQAIRKMNSLQIRRRERENNPLVCRNCQAIPQLAETKKDVVAAVTEYLRDSWKAHDLNFRHSLWYLRVECLKCETVFNRLLVELRKTMERGESHKCRCYARKTARKVAPFQVNTVMAGWHIDAARHSNRGHEIDVRCEKCNAANTVSSFKLNFYRGKGTDMPCQACENSKVLEMKVPDWQIEKGTGSYKGRWRVTHKCGYSRRAKHAEIEEVAKGKGLKCTQCADRPSHSYAYALLKRLTAHQQRYVALVLADRTRVIDGEPIMTKSEMIYELRDTVEMCRNWDDERCREEVAFLRTPKFHAETSTNYAPHYGGSRGRSGDIWA